MDNLRGSLLMILAMAGFALEDLCLKIAAQGLPVGQVLLIFGAGGMLSFAVLATLKGQNLFDPRHMGRAVLTRAGFEVTGRMFHTLAIALIPLSAASAILQATPLVVVAGAALIFGERVGWRRWLAILIGFLGVMVVLRPGLEGFDILSLLAVAGMLGFAGRDLATRAAPRSVPNLVLGVYGFAMILPAGALLLTLSGGARWPDGTQTLALAVAIGIGVASYNALTGAMRMGDVSVVTPWRYTRLVFALILAVVVLGEQVDAPTLIGSAIIVGSGLYTLWRGRRRAG